MQVAGAVGAYALQISSGVSVTAPVPSTFDWHGAWKIEAWLRVVQDAVPSIGCTVREVYKYPSTGGIAICDENGYTGGASASDCTGSWFRIPHECNTLAANTDPILANVYRDGALLYENINLDINLDGLGANTVDVGGKSGTKNDEDWKIGDFVVWQEHEVSAASQERPESPVLYFVDSVLELSETTSSAIPAVLTSAIDPGVGPVPSDWKQIRLEHEFSGGNMAKLYVDGQELVDAGVNLTALYQGGGIRMTNVVVDDLRVYADASSNTSTQDTETTTPAPQERITPVRNLARMCGTGADSCTVSAYSTQGGHTDPPQMVVDGEKPAGYGGTVLWLASSPGYNYCGAGLNTACSAESWLQIDLGQSRSVQSIGIWFRKDCCAERQNAFEIYIGDSASTKGLTKSAENTMCYQDATSAGSTPLSLNVTCVGFGRYVLLYFPQASASVGEIEVFGVAPAPSSIVVSDGLKEYFKLENSLANEIGTTTLQVKQNDNGVVANPVFAIHEGKAALHLDNLWIDTTYDFGSTHSIACWVYAKNHFGAQYSNTPIVVFGDQNSGGEIALSGRKVYTAPYPQTSVNYVNSGDFDSTMAWFHIAFVQNGGEWEIFINGQKLYDNFAFAAEKKNEMKGALKLFRYVNQYSVNTGYLNGYAKFLRLYNRVLSAAEVQTIYETEKTLENPQTLAQIDRGAESWRLVRYMPAAASADAWSWHPIDDDLAGTSTYGDSGDMSQPWSVTFGIFTHYMLGACDMSLWGEIAKGQYEATPTSSAYMNWAYSTTSCTAPGMTGANRKAGNVDDPLFSVDCIGNWPDQVVYAEDSYAGMDAAVWNRGACVWVNSFFVPTACTDTLPTGFDGSLTGDAGTNGVCYIKYAGTGGNPDTSTGQSLGACDQDHTYFYVSKSCIEQLGYAQGSTLTVEHYRGSTKQADRGILFWWKDTTWNNIGPNGDHNAFPGNSEKLLQGRTNPTGSNVFRSNDYFVIPSI
jgi:hypothetical protein